MPACCICLFFLLSFLTFEARQSVLINKLKKEKKKNPFKFKSKKNNLAYFPEFSLKNFNNRIYISLLSFFRVYLNITFK